MVDGSTKVAVVRFRSRCGLTSDGEDAQHDEQQEAPRLHAATTLARRIHPHAQRDDHPDLGQSCCESERVHAATDL